MVNLKEEKGTFATEQKRERVYQFSELLKEFDNKPISKFMAFAEFRLGISENTAQHYLKMFKNMEYIKVEKDKKLDKDILKVLS